MFGGLDKYVDDLLVVELRRNSVVSIIHLYSIVLTFIT